MVSLRTARGSNLRTRKAGGQQPNSIPDLFICAFHECRRRKPHLLPHGHSSWTKEQLQVYLTVTWEKAGPYRQKLYWNPAEGFSNSGQSHSIETEPRVSSDVKRAPRIASRAKGRKAPLKSRTKRTGTLASPPPATQGQPATSPPLDDLEPVSPLTPHSTCSSASVPLQLVMKSTGSPPREPAAGSSPPAQHAGGALSLHPYPLSTAERDGGAASSAACPSFPFVPPGYVQMHPPPTLSPALRAAPHAMWRGSSLPGSASGDGVPVPEIDPSLLDMQRQMREQMSRYYPSTHPSLGYAHMPSAVEHWPWR